MAKMKICDICGRALPKEDLVKFPVFKKRHFFQRDNDVCHGCFRELFRAIPPGEGRIRNEEWERIANIVSIRRRAVFARQTMSEHEPMTKKEAMEILANIELSFEPMSPKERMAAAIYMEDDE